MSEYVTDEIKAVVFDFDDTLIGTHRAIWDLHRHIAKTYYDIELDDETLMRHWGRPLHELASNYYGTEDTEAAIAWMVHHQKDFPKEKFEYTESVLMRLKLGNKVLGLVSATTRQILKKDAEIAGIPLDIIDYIQTGEDTEVHKPDPGVFAPMLRYMYEREILPHEIIYVGDGIHDMRAAHGANIKFLGVETGLVAADEFAQFNASSIPDASRL